MTDVVCDAGPLIHLDELDVLLRAVRRGLKPKATILDVLRSLPERSTLFINSELLQQVIEELRSV